MKKKVIIGMSGGVDSSVSAALLIKQGYEVIGLTMILHDKADFSSSVNDAKFVCNKLGIQHLTVDFRKQFEEYVINYFTKEYLSGRTPNPCIVCNKHLKFDAMLKEAEKLGADYIATGHYAKIEFDKELGRFVLKKSDAAAKDQTYALYTLTSKQLSKILMPLGDIKDKNETRKIAEELGLLTARKKDSMEICFIPDNDYVSFITNRTKKSPEKGNFIDKDGNILGTHNGIINYTIGQRKGLGVTFGKPMFVVKINAGDNTVMLAESGFEFSNSLTAKNLNFISIDIPNAPVKVMAKIRYSAKEAPATLTVKDETAYVLFDTPQRAITPGQAVVFYSLDSNCVLGGGIIE